MKNTLGYLMLAAVWCALFQPIAAEAKVHVKSLPDRSRMTVKGYVLCGDKGVKDVVVSDGTNVVRTDSKGRYWLPTDVSTSDFVMISTPRGYEVESYKGYLPRFFHPLNRNDGVQRFDFHLTKTCSDDDYVLVVVADEHVSKRVLDVPKGSGNLVAPIDTVQYANVFIPRLIEYTKSFPRGTKFYGLNLGDMTHSEYWFTHGADMEAYVRLSKDVPFQMYHVIGNHDHCHKDTDNHAAEAEYRRHFGPTYYSFNLGAVHYIVLDNMHYHGRNKYDRIVTLRQIEWLKKDLAALDPTISDLVIAAHVPLTLSADTPNGFRPYLSNWNELYDIIKDYKVTIMTGDWHASMTTFVSENITEYLHPSLCGTWWYRPVCTEGTPASFLEYRFGAEGLKSRKFIDFNDPGENLQYRVYNKGITTNTCVHEHSKDDLPGGELAILINFWGYNDSWEFVCRENGNIVEGRGAMVDLYDPLHREYVENGFIETKLYSWTRSKKVRHMFRYVPANKIAEIEITAIDHYHNETFVIRTKVEELSDKK
ncbi:metallophosphoesterase N-terminal domain-containing protein [Alistipes shahii]|jgi:hypothetical protein|uniref:metallophosphoesterase N-terminal domain-containing protein n=1 Tax=Alistipes shahii TaxID=328814 RepID=UPI0020981230|nr:metallophosphoesterase N-terminal domain-containing protein [Alistipes shahii]MCO7107272.1 calcineurin-like phosphoesterase family protein [Alistipes shahii]